MEPKDLNLQEGSVLLGQPLWTIADVQFYGGTWLSHDDMRDAIVAFVDSEETWTLVLDQLNAAQPIPHLPDVAAVLPSDRAIVYLPPEGGLLVDQLETFRHPSRALPLLLDIAQTIQSLHERGWILQGIRPDQIGVDRRGRGVLLRLPPWPSENATRYRDYTEGYVAPEVLFGGEIGPSSDVYILGALLYKLIFDKDPSDFFSPNVRSPLREIFRAPWPGVVQILVQSVALQRDRLPDVRSWIAYVDRIYRLEFAPRIKIDVGVFSSIGRNPNRLHNEDAYAYTLHKQQGYHSDMLDEGLFLVADGMGGGARGEEAAITVIEEIKRVLRDAPFEEESIRKAIHQANQKVFKRAKGIFGDTWDTYMGTTIAAVWMQWPEAWIFNVGDTRIYLLRDQSCTQLSVDHSALAQAGKSNPRGNPSRHELAYAVGPWENLPPEGIHVKKTVLKQGDWVFILTDGVWEAITEEEMIAWASESVTAQDLARRMVRVAVERSGQDNATAMVIQIPGGGSNS